jgi:hypothetical protein
LNPKNLAFATIGSLLLVSALTAWADEEVITNGLDVDVRQYIDESPHGQPDPAAEQGVANVQDLGAEAPTTVGRRMAISTCATRPSTTSRTSDRTPPAISPEGARAPDAAAQALTSAISLRRVASGFCLGPQGWGSTKSLRQGEV